jgi:hypothetical protein
VAWLGRGTAWARLMCSRTNEHPNEIGDKTCVNINTRRVRLFVPWFDMIYLITEIGLTAGGRSTVYIYT